MVLLFSATFLTFLYVTRYEYSVGFCAQKTQFSLNRGEGHELSLIFGPVQNHILYSTRVTLDGLPMATSSSVSIVEAHQENPQDIGFDTFPVLIFIYL